MTSEALNLLYEAQASSIGILIQTDEPERLRQQLYSARRKAADRLLEDLQIRFVALPDGNLAIVKREILVGAENAEK